MRIVALAIFVFGFVLPAAVAQPQETSPVRVEVADPRADVALTTEGQSSPPLPSNPFSEKVDIVGLRVLEPDEEMLVFELEAAGKFKPVTLNARGASFGNVHHQVFFKIPGEGSIRIDVIVQVSSFLQMDPFGSRELDMMPFNANVCVMSSPGQQFCDFYASRPLGVQIADGKLVIELPKAYLLRDNQLRATTRSAVLPLQLRPGDEITDLHARAITGSAFDYSPFGGAGPRLRDRAPDAGVLGFPLRFPSPTPDLRIGPLQWAVVQGEETILPFELTNLGTHKRIVNLSVHQIRSSPDGAWEHKVTPTVTLGPGKGTNVTLRVKAPSEAGLGVGSHVRIRAEVVTEPGMVAISYAFFTSQPALDADHSTYWFHGQRTSFEGLDMPGPFAYGLGVLSRSQEHPRYTATSVPMNGFISLPVGSPLNLMLMGEPIPNPATFRKGEPVQSQFALKTDLPIKGTFTLILLLGDTILGEASRPVNLPAGTTNIELAMPVPPHVERVDPMNGTLRAQLRLQVDAPESALTMLGLGKVSVLTKVSSVRLPVDREAPLLRSQPRFQVSLAGSEDLQGFVNPGRTIVYELDLRNEDEQRLSLALELQNLTDGWIGRVEPSQRFRLDGDGDSAHVGVLLTAPKNTPEASRVDVRLVVREIESGEIVAAQWLRTIVTSGLEIENETFTARDEDRAKLEVSTRSNTVPGLGAVVTFGIASLLVLRRRRTGS